MDEDISQYRISTRAKKWWWPLFTWIVDAIINNAWLMYRKAGHEYQITVRSTGPLGPSGPRSTRKTFAMIGWTI